MDTPKARATRRAKSAQKLDASLKQLYSRAFKLPPFTGKAPFIDRIKAVETLAHNLAFDLTVDAQQTP